MRSHNGFEMSVLVGHKEITEYPHEGMTFVEGRHGSEYTIRVRNNTYRRACFVVSVDGLSVLDGKNAADDSPGYVLNAHQTLDIACYKVDSATGAKFIFGCKEQSYTAEIGNGTDNTGVIAVKAYQEKYPEPPIFYHARYRALGKTGGGGLHAASASMRSSAKGGSGAKGWGMDSVNTIGSSCNSADSFGTNSSDDLYRGIVPSSAPEPVEQQLGTVFGEAMKWETTTVSFVREAVGTVMVLYYDTKKNLERRGIKISKRPKPMPNPFPGNKGCEPPHGWRK